MWTDDDDQRVINDNFGGDTARYLADLHESRRKVVKWDNLVASANILPELAINAQELIVQLLGYLPNPLLTMQEEPFIRAVLHNYKSGSLTVDELFDQAEEHIKPIRNADLADHADLAYERRLYQKYFTAPIELVDKGLTRLRDLLGYEPALEYSLAAELNLHDCFMNDGPNFNQRLRPADIRAIAIIKYRETLFAAGKAAADASPLLALDLIAAQRLKSKPNSYLNSE